MIDELVYGQGKDFEEKFLFQVLCFFGIHTIYKLYNI